MLPIPMGRVTFHLPSNRRLGGTIEEQDEQLHLYSGYNEWLKDEFKSMDGARWLGGKDQLRPVKAWGVKNNERNRFRLAYLVGLNPYAHYDKPLELFKPRRARKDGTPIPYGHQLEMSAFELTRRQCIIAGEMGVGKTLAATEVLEQSGIPDWLWIGPRSALDSVKYEFNKWRFCQICGKLGMHHRNENHPIIDDRAVIPVFRTYEEVKKIVEGWTPGCPAPHAIVFDEASRLKNPTAQRTQAARALTDAMRNEYGLDAFIILMTGTPAPKDPSDWWSLCEIARPGFLREGNLQKFKQRLCKIEYYDSEAGGSYPKLVTWWDNESKCGQCGKFEDDANHHPINITESWYHSFRKSVNEVQKLYERLKGLVLVKMKKDCLDLPEKIYKQVVCRPTPSVLRAANMITRTAKSTVKGLTLLRELSDGFQYKEVACGTKTCPSCKGGLIIKITVDLDDPENPLDSESLARGRRVIWDEESDQIIGVKDEPLRLGEKELPCPQCGGDGEVTDYTREATRVDSPKDQALTDILDQYEEEGRVIIWAGFTESVDRCTQLCLSNGWPVIRLDGRGWWSNSLTSKSGPEILAGYDDKDAHPKLAFVGQPGAGGMGLNLTASSVEVYFSNTFKFEDRAQSEDRFHRPGADHNRGCTVIDLIHLPQDLWVLENLKRKRDLQAMTMGQLVEAASKYEEQLARAV